MQIKTIEYNEEPPHIRMAIVTMPPIANAGEGVANREHSYTAGGKVSWWSHYGEQYGGSSEK